MNKTEKKDFVTQVYLEARSAGLCHTQGEFAALLGVTAPTMSKALKGDEDYLTENFVFKVRAWRDQTLGKKEKEPEPEPDIVIPARTFDMFKNMSEALRLQAEMLARMGAGTAPGYTSPKNFRIETK